jgi:putative secretion ATPase (PEP-CTERM system associated)
MYEEFFHLKAKPFELVPDPEFLFLSKSHKKAMTYLEYGIRERIGFILVTGEIGSGKTTILRNLIRELDDKVTLSKVFNTRVTSEQLIALINEDFGLAVSGKDKIGMLRDLNDFLVAEYASHRQPILIIDEAQNLNLKLLEEVRLLSNLESDKHKLLQIVLVGQPELRKTLSRPELAQLKQRISISCHIQPLGVGETGEYIRYRLEKAGKRDAVSFCDESINIIQQFSHGIPRLINVFCDFLMLAAFVEKTREWDPELLRDVVGELEAENRLWEIPTSSQEVSPASPPFDEMITRINRLELALESLSTENPGSGSATRVCELEAMVQQNTELHQFEFKELTKIVSNLNLDLHKLERRIKPLERDIGNKVEIRRKGFWNWMTS